MKRCAPNNFYSSQYDEIIISHKNRLLHRLLQFKESSKIGFSYSQARHLICFKKNLLEMYFLEEHTFF